MNVITLSALLKFAEEYPDAEIPLREWYKHVTTQEFRTFAEVQEQYGNADWAHGYIIFNIGGNKYRLIVKPNFLYKSFFVKFIGTHKQYDALELKDGL